VIARLHAGEAGRVEAFLRARGEAAMFLRSHLELAGLPSPPRAEASLWAGSRADGELDGVGVHAWNGVLLLAAPGPIAGALAHWLALESQRQVTAVQGPSEAVAAALAALGLDEAPTLLATLHTLMAADTRQIALPAALVLGEVKVRHPYAHELDRLIAWRVAAAREAGESGDEGEFRAVADREIRELRPREHQFVALSEGEPVAMASFNAVLADAVQVGTVFVPPDRRGRGYGRCAVAAALMRARERGVLRASLHVDPGNASAIAAYESLGFTAVGEQRLVVFA